MRKSIVAAATIAAVLSIGTPTRNATAMPVVTPGQLGLAGGVADSVEKTSDLRAVGLPLAPALLGMVPQPLLLSVVLGCPR